ncbi:MAG: methyltransferase [Oscillospiraceae bacterium]|nr:methyltransferase [Oscillospiraceae bacterium]
MTSRELVYKTLAFENTEWRAPRELWVLPWANMHYGAELAQIRKKFPNDFTSVDPCYSEKDASVGDAYKKGRYTDAWGCTFEMFEDGYIGEVKAPLVDDDAWADTSRVRFPTELLSVDVDRVNAQCAATDKFVKAATSPNPFERLQFIRTSERLYYDLADVPGGLRSFMAKLHTFYCDVLELWAKTDVDALTIFDDWGAQNALLISPALWRELFKPLYKDYIDIAHRAGKKAFMHSDGHTLAIYPDLIELGLDAFNSQIFCMGVGELAKFKGKITFWGEIDRQNMLPFATVGEIAAAVRSVREALWQNGGAIAQCEFSVGSNPANVHAVFETWNKYGKPL